MNTEKEINENLFLLYKSYIDIMEKQYPELRAELYSSVYCTTAPAEWTNSENRFLIIGEEGYGKKPHFPTAEEEVLWAQEFNADYLRQQLYENRDNRSRFWQRFRRISEFGKCSWSNFDKIHNQKDNSSRNNCPLSENDRAKLHSLPPLLKREIDYLSPTLIIFFGWHWVSLKHELPSVYDKMKMLDKPGRVKPLLIEDDNKKYLVAYHPSFRTREYEDTIISLINETIG